MTATRITLLATEFRQMVKGLNGDHSFPALEQVLSRGRACPVKSATANHLRSDFFGLESDKALPVAALTHVSDRKKTLKDDYYWLRCDPVTMRADMTKVFMTGHGIADLDPDERNEIENCVRAVLMEEELDLHTDHPERWCIALKEPLLFEFTPLDNALGRDVADTLPTHSEARSWRRILNEIQVALHNCPINIQRRQSGKQEINSVWFWGGGFIPRATSNGLFDTVYSNHPVTRGLAIINDSRLKKQSKASLGNLRRDERSVLVDWVTASQYAEEGLEELEALVKPLLKPAGSGEISFTLFDGSGEGWLYDRSARLRFWRRKAQLGVALASGARA